MMKLPYVNISDAEAVRRNMNVKILVVVEAYVIDMQLMYLTRAVLITFFAPDVQKKKEKECRKVGKSDN